VERLSGAGKRTLIPGDEWLSLGIICFGAGFGFPEAFKMKVPCKRFE
jgi:hypothetical protein